MAGSAAVSVKRALRDALQAHEALAGVQIEYGIPAMDTLNRERIFLGRARFDHDPGSMKAGRVFRNEQGTLEVYVDAVVIGDQEAADGRVIELGQVVEDVVADNRNLGNDLDAGINVTAVTMRAGELIEATLDTGSGSVARITYTLRWDARLT